MSYDDLYDQIQSRPKYQADEKRRREYGSWKAADGSAWYALRVEAQKEFALAGKADADGEWIPGILERKGYDRVFLPTETKFKKTMRKGRRVSLPVVYPLFTSYIFVGGRFSWQHLLAENHIWSVVGFANDRGERQPAPISEAAMAKLKDMSGALVPHRRSVNPHRALRVGELAEISVGPFQGQIVKIEGLHGRKARVFLNLFSTRKEVEIGIEDLEAA